MRAKWIAVLSGLLLLGVVLAGFAGAGPPGKDTVYVDDDHKCDGNKPCVGTIQRGVDRVKVGGNVVVYGGLYEENVVVDKAIRIEAADLLDKPVVDGEALGPTVEVIVSGVEIVGLAVTNGVDGVRVTADSFLIEESDVTGNADNGVEIVGSAGSEVGPNNVMSLNGASGLYAYLTVELSVHDNTASDNGDYGIFLEDSQDADISGNTANGNGINGIYFYMVDPSIIVGNSVGGSGGTGINVSASQDITVQDNDVSTSGGDGISFWETDPSFILGNSISGSGDDGIEVFASDFITVADNDIQTSGDDGISFWEVDPSFILGNDVSDSDGDGIEVYDSDYITVDGNSISTSGGDGIFFWETDPSTISNNQVSLSGDNGVNVSKSVDITVNDNDVSTSGGDGISFWETDPSYILGNTVTNNDGDGVDVTSSQDITVSGNDIQTNGGDGIFFWETDPSFIQENNLQGNGGDGIDLLDSVDILVKDNEVKGNAYGIRMTRGHGNQVFQNNFIDNTISLTVFDAPDAQWDSGCDAFPYIVGNFWSDFAGGDDGTSSSRCGEDRIAGDGIGDTGTSGGFGGADWYPVLEPSGWLAIQQRLYLSGEIDPGTDEKPNQGNWVQVKVFVPKDSGYHAKDIVKSSLKLAGNFGFVDWEPSPSSTSEGPDGSTLHVKFDRDAWLAIVTEGEWCYAILGEFKDGQTFIAVDCVVVK